MTRSDLTRQLQDTLADTEISAEAEHPIESAKNLFGVECSHRVEAHGAQRRDIAGGDGDRGKYKRDSSERGQIVRRHAEEQSGHEVRNNKRANQAYAGADGGQSEALA